MSKAPELGYITVYIFLFELAGFPHIFPSFISFIRFELSYTLKSFLIKLLLPENANTLKARSQMYTLFSFEKEERFVLGRINLLD